MARSGADSFDDHCRRTAAAARSSADALDDRVRALQDDAVAVQHAQGGRRRTGRADSLSPVRIHDEIQYDASPADVAALLSQREFHQEVAERMGSLSSTVEVDGAADAAFTVTTVRTMPTDAFPDVARKFVGSTVDVRQVEAWGAAEADGSRAGTLTVDIVGAPLRLDGTLALTPSRGGAVQALEGELKANVPLFGGKLEKAAEPAIRAAIRQQQKAATARLA